MGETKRCKTCELDLPLESFHRKTGGKDGRQPNCRSCRSQQERGRDLRANNLQRLYGLSLEQYDALLEQQFGTCAICGCHPVESHRGRLAVDHDHGTGVVRGLLCNNCNNGLGRFKDDPARLRAAVTYLERAPFFSI